LVADLKTYIATELSKSDHRIKSLESEIEGLKDALTDSYSKINRLEENISEVKALFENAAPATQAPSAPPPESIDTVVAGDSIVKHLKLDELDGNNRLICLPGARSHKVHLAVRKLAKSASMKNLVLHFGTNHFGTNHLPDQSPSRVANEIAETLKRIQCELPDTKLYYSAILPKFDSFYNRGINFINTSIAVLCREYDIGFIQHTAFCRRGVLSKTLYAPTEWQQGRPLHPSHEGARTLQTNIKLGMI
jgi:hypothetical protein